MLNKRTIYKISLSFAWVMSVSSSVTAALNPGEPVRIQLGGEPSTLDPAMVIDMYGFNIMRHVVEGLTKLDRDGNVRMGLAESHSVSKDGLTYRFKLRSNARWSDGQPVAVEDVVAGLQRAVDPKVNSPNAVFFFSIKNAREIYEGKKNTADLGVLGQGSELIIQLAKPDPVLLENLASPTAAPVRRDYLQAHGGRWDHQAPVTGDYLISRYIPSDVIELKPNPQRIKSSEVRPIQYRILSEEVTAMNLFESRRMDIITTVTATEISRLEKKGLIQKIPSTTVFYFGFHHGKPPFNEKSWRQAVASSVDREGLSKILNGGYTPIASYLPRPIEGSGDLKSLQFPEAIARIRALSVEMKPKIRLAYGASAFTKVVAEKTQHDLAVRLGIKISLEPMELKSLLARLKTDDAPEMYFLGMSAMYNDPLNQLNAFSTTASAGREPTFSRYQSQSFESLLETIRTTPRGAKRTKAAADANRLLVEEDVALVPMVLRLQVFGVNPDLKNFHVSPYQSIDLSALRK